MAARTTAAPRQRTAKADRAPVRALNQDPTAVRQAREARGMTQKELAEKTGRKHTHISEIEGGTRDARPELLERIAHALGVNVELLERRRPRVACPRCNYRYDLRGDGTIPLHLRDGNAFCDVNSPAVAEAA